MNRNLENGNCPDCGLELTRNSDTDSEDTDGKEFIESFWSCPVDDCGVFVTIIRQCK